jgi:ribosome-binding factor A
MRRKRSNREERAAGPSQRQLRVGEEIRHVLVEVLARGQLRDPDLQGVSITVAEVRMSPDLKHATAYVMPLGGEKVDTIVKALRRASGFLRAEVARSVQLRRPEVQRDLGGTRPDDDDGAQGR